MLENLRWYGVWTSSFSGLQGSFDFPVFLKSKQVIIDVYIIEDIWDDLVRVVDIWR